MIHEEAIDFSFYEFEKLYQNFITEYIKKIFVNLLYIMMKYLQKKLNFIKYLKTINLNNLHYIIPEKFFHSELINHEQFKNFALYVMNKLIKIILM